MINRQENVDVTGLDVDMKKKIVYWSDGESLKALKKSFFSFEIKMYVEGWILILKNEKNCLLGFLGTVNRLNMETREFKSMSQLGRPGVLAIDWATDNVYFYNGENPPTIKACNLEELKCAQVVEIAVSVKIMSIAVDPVNGFVSTESRIFFVA